MKKPIKFLVAILLCLPILLAFGCGEGKEKEPEPSPTANITAAPTIKPTAEPTPEITPDPNATPKPEILNLVEGKDATTNYNESGRGANYAIDGDESTRWSGFDLGFPNHETDPVHWIQVDLGGEFYLTEFEISWEFLRVSYKVEVSMTGEEGSWTTVYDYEDVSTGALVDFGAFDPAVKAKFVRVITYLPEGVEMPTHSAGMTPYCSIYEFYCYGYVAVEG